MYAKNIRPRAKREVQKERSAKRDVQIFRNAMRMCPRRGQIFEIETNQLFNLGKVLTKCN